jgi:transcriptional regulator with XRE-family HTH domain
MYRETVSQFVDRVMRQKGLSARDIERNSGKKVDNSYVSKLLSGKVPNPGINSIIGLAEGLNINPHEILTAVSGQPPPDGQQVSPDAMVVVDIMQKLVMDPELMEVLQEWMRLLPEDKKRVMKSLRFLNEQNQKMRQSRARKKKKR